MNVKRIRTKMSKVPVFIIKLCLYLVVVLYLRIVMAYLFLLTYSSIDIYAQYSDSVSGVVPKAFQILSNVTMCNMCSQ